MKLGHRDPAPVKKLTLDWVAAAAVVARLRPMRMAYLPASRSDERIEGDVDSALEVRSLREAASQTPEPQLDGAYSWPKRLGMTLWEGSGEK